MGFIEFFHLIGSALKDLGSYFSSSIVELLGGLFALVVFSLKAYQVGRDGIIKRFRPFIIGESGFWDKPPTRSIYKHQEALKSSIPILTIANFKGGVGKSTVAANLAACLDDHGGRILLLDLDFQGSLTDTLTRTDNLSFGTLRLMDPDFRSRELPEHFTRPISNFRTTSLIASNYTLLEEESRSLFKWIVRDTKKDIRYFVHRFLQSAHVQAHFDVVIIDASPRITTASVNALCASTHVLIPTILDGTSTTAAINTVSAVHNLKDKLSPSLELLGILPTFVNVRTGYNDREQSNLSFIRQTLRDNFPNQEVRIFEAERILRREAIATVAGDGVAYFHNAEVCEMYKQLGQRIASEINRGWLREFAHESERDGGRSDGNAADVIQMEWERAGG